MTVISQITGGKNTYDCLSIGYAQPHMHGYQQNKSTICTWIKLEVYSK